MGTDKEDEALRGAIELHGDKNWAQIELYPGLELRTRSQCMTRWRLSLGPSVQIKRAKWTFEEVFRLRMAVIAQAGPEYGRGTPIDQHRPISWVKISKHVPGRTYAQCRERFYNFLDPQ